MEKTEGIFDWELVKILNILRKFDIKAIIDLPNIEDSEETRTWVQAVADTLEALAEMTPISVDDDVINVLKCAISDDVTWSAFHGLLLKQFAAAESDDDIRYSARLDTCKELGDPLGIDPITIISIIMAVKELIDLIRKWRNR